MNDYDKTLKQQLTHDAIEFQNQADRHLNESNLSAGLMAQLKSVEQVSNEVQRKKTPWLIPASLAASVCFLVLLWQKNEHQLIDDSQMVINNTQTTFALQISQLPLSLENKTNEHLQKEQQAIFADIKSLKGRWIKI